MTIRLHRARLSRKNTLFFCVIFGRGGFTSSTSNIDLHFKSTQNMLPYFIAVGHHQYAKRTRMSLQRFDAWSQQCPHLMDKVFGKGHHTVRYSSRNWRHEYRGVGNDRSQNLRWDWSWNSMP